MLLAWEEDASKVSIGVYPHMSNYWEELELPDTSSKDVIKAQYRKLSIMYHPDKNTGDDKENRSARFKTINEAYHALKDIDGNLAFPWDVYPERRHEMSGRDVLNTFGFLGAEAASVDPIKAQAMQHVVKEATE